MKINTIQKIALLLVCFGATSASAQYTREEICKSVPEAYRSACLNQGVTTGSTVSPTTGSNTSTTNNTYTCAYDPAVCAGSGTVSSTTTLPVTTTTTFPWNLHQDLKQGSKGLPVRLLQAVLMHEGYLKIGRTTTSFGKLTTAAVKKFQAEYDLDETGKIEADERDVLNEILDEMQKAGYITVKGVVKFPPAGYTTPLTTTAPTQTQQSQNTGSNSNTRPPICDAFGNCY